MGAERPAGKLARIDPRTNRITATVAPGNTPRRIAVGAGGVWLTGYSDGILDAVIDGVDEQRISEVLAEVPHASATDLVGALLGSIRRIDRVLRDDVAFIALRHAGARGSSS